MDIQGICHDFVFIDLGFSRMTSFFAVGLGCDSRTPLETLRAALEQALARAGIAPGHIVAAASITLKAKEPGLLALVAERGWPMRFYTPAELAAVPVPNPSETVLRYTGTPSVSEAAALLAAGGGGQPAPMSALVVEKHRLRGPDGRNATVSIARVPPESAALPND
jgi:cobalamin (vitamin B12) biosynthesis cbiG protein